MLAREVARVARCYRERLAVCKPGLDQFPQLAVRTLSREQCFDGRIRAEKHRDVGCPEVTDQLLH